MLKYVAINLYAPCYVLIVHYSLLPQGTEEACWQGSCPSSSRKQKSLAFIGGVLDDTVNLDLSEPTRPELVKVNGKFLIKQPGQSFIFFRAPAT
jgi:hypothetical protein